MYRELDQVLAYHCGPALAGVKVANLVSLSLEEFPELRETAAKYNRLFQGKGVSFRLLCGCGKRALLLVYREEQLARQLREPLAAELLRRDGYPEGADVERLLELLSTRLRMGKEFPHEIGLFLGYPPEDVLGFQRYRGQNCKLCGYWKVYSDVDRARVLFRLYDRCREVLCRRVARGMTLSEVFLAA